MNGPVHFREATPADRDAILALRTIAFPSDDVEKQQPDFWTWQFVDGYAGSGTIFVAEARDRIVGHLAFVPQRYVAGQQVLRGVLAADGMTHPEHRRQKVFAGLTSFAASRLRRDFQVATAFHIRRVSLGGMLAGGWTTASRVSVLIDPLSIRHIARDVGLPLPDWRAAERRSGKGDDPAIRPLEPGDLEQIDALLATSSVRQNRTTDYLQWRYRQNAHWQYGMHGVFDGGRLLAFLIHRESTLRRFRALAIADAGVLPGSETSLRRLVRHVCAMGRDRGAGIAAALLSRHHPAYRALRRSGFLPGPHRFRFMLQVFDESLQWLHRAPWSLSWGDTDHL